MALDIGKKQTVSSIDAKWRDYHDEDCSASFLIRGIDYKPFQNAVAMITRHEQKMDKLLDGGLTVDLLNLAAAEGIGGMDAHFLVAAQHLIADWRDVKDDGEDVPYSADLANTVMKAKPLIYAWLIGQARMIQQSANAQVDETVKKPLPDTTGSSKTKPRKKPSSSASG